MRGVLAAGLVSEVLNGEPSRKVSPCASGRRVSSALPRFSGRRPPRRIEELEVETATAAEAARAAGCDEGEIVKSLVAVCDDTAVLALVPGDRRADTGKVARAVGASTGRIAHAREVTALTGFSPGAVAPFGLRGSNAS